MATRDAVVDKLKNQIDALNTEIDDLEAGVRKASGDAEKEIHRQLDRVRDSRAQFDARLDALKAAGEDNWDHLKEEAEHAFKAASNSVAYFKSHFR